MEKATGVTYNFACRARQDTYNVRPLLATDYAAKALTRHGL